MITVVVVVIVALLAVALIAGWFGGKPTVSFSTVLTGGAGQNRTAMWSVTSVSQQNSFSSYKVAMDKDSAALGSTQTLAAFSILSFGSGVTLAVGDIDVNGKLTSGDLFLVYGMDQGHSWTFRLLWNDGSLIQSAKWGGTSSVTIGITLISSGSGTNWTMVISALQGSVAYADVFMTISDAGGVNVPNMTSVSLADLTLANWDTHHVLFQNLGGGPDLTVGSSILVDKPTYPSGYRYQLVVNSMIAAMGTFQ